ncbi:unnamed protein product [Amoebophrya sp. A25]|nr:unnamed protein product [Amoebophrya sp. A25]|eukprot:GSA25T00021292001.1
MSRDSEAAGQPKRAGPLFGDEANEVLRDPRTPSAPSSGSGQPGSHGKRSPNTGPQESSPPPTAEATKKKRSPARGEGEGVSKNEEKREGSGAPSSGISSSATSSTATPTTSTGQQNATTTTPTETSNPEGAPVACSTNTTGFMFGESPDPAQYWGRNADEEDVSAWAASQNHPEVERPAEEGTSAHMWDTVTTVLSTVASQRHGAHDFFSFLDPSVLWRLRETHSAAYVEMFKGAALLREKSVLIEALISCIYTRAVYGLPMYEGYVDSAATWVQGAMQKVNMDKTENEILNAKAFHWKIGEVLVSGYTEEMYEPGFVLSANHRLKWLVLSVRGSMAWQDVMTDIAANDVDFNVRIPKEGGPLWNVDPLKIASSSTQKNHQEVQAASSTAQVVNERPLEQGLRSPTASGTRQKTAGDQNEDSEDELAKSTLCIGTEYIGAVRKPDHSSSSPTLSSSKIDSIPPTSPKAQTPQPQQPLGSPHRSSSTSPRRSSVPSSSSPNLQGVDRPESPPPLFIDQTILGDDAETMTKLMFRTHKGFVKSAEYVYRRVRTAVERFLRRYPDYRFIFTGHSLGAATVALVYFKFCQVVNKRLLLFGSPAIVAEHEEMPSDCGNLVRATQDPRILGVVRGKDFVSQLSMQSFDRLADEISETSYFTQAVDYVSSLFSGSERPAKDYSGTPRPAGKFCLHLQVRPSTAAPTCFWTRNSGQNYRRVLLGLRMIDDHLPNLYLATLCDVYFNKFFRRNEISDEEYVFLKMLKRIRFDYVQAYMSAKWV